MLNLSEVEQKALKEIREAINSTDLENLRIKYLGRKNGIISELTGEIPKLSPNDRAGIGTAINKLKKTLEKAFDQKSTATSKEPKRAIDVTVPGKKPRRGSLHPLTLIMNEVKDIFHYLGFTSLDGPEVENDYYNFQALNIDPDHPSRDVQQTYYLKEGLVLRTHTSNMQVRYMENHKPPIRVLFPGRVYRRDATDATHFPAFHQIEGLLVDETTNMTELLGTLDYFAKQVFGEKTRTRIYGHHFPYTEPSIEIEVDHPTKGWVELLGAGMVHPNVLKNAGIDPQKYRGWAFGMGADRLAMIKYNIDDVRLLFTNDLRFLDQF